MKRLLFVLALSIFLAGCNEAIETNMNEDMIDFEQSRSRWLWHSEVILDIMEAEYVLLQNSHAEIQEQNESSF